MRVCACICGLCVCEREKETRDSSLVGWQEGECTNENDGSKPFVMISRKRESEHGKRGSRSVNRSREKGREFIGKTRDKIEKSRSLTTLRIYSMQG